MRNGLVLLIFLGVLGCNREAKLGPVSGTVTIDGKPVTAGVVTFVAVDQSNAASSEITPEGTYSIADAPTGEVVISVRTRDHAVILGPNSSPLPRDPGAAGSAAYNPTQKKNPLYVPTPDRYEDLSRSDLRITIPKTGARFEHNIEMTK